MDFYVLIQSLFWEAVLECSLNFYALDSVKWNISLSPRREILTCFLVIFVQNWIVVILRKTVGQNVRTLDFNFECLDLNMFTRSSFDLRNFPNWMTSRHFAWLKDWSWTFRSVPRVRNIMLENSSFMLLSVTPENIDVFPKLCFVCLYNAPFYT